jgi:hypothetical protein
MLYVPSSPGPLVQINTGFPVVCSPCWLILLALGRGVFCTVGRVTLCATQLYNVMSLFLFLFIVNCYILELIDKVGNL